ncbi:MAG: PAC2 family protein [Candidatus Micrarchaeota archaeon]
MKLEIVLDKKYSLKNYTLLLGFPGVGLVGTIAAGYIIEKRKMAPIGHVYCDRFPPMATVHEGKPYFPARIYKDPEKDFCVLIAEFMVPSIAVHEFAEKILAFAKETGIKQIISIAGMTSANQEIKKPGTYGIASNDEIYNYLTGKGVKMIKEGVTTGVSGIIVAKAAVENYPAASLLVESKYGYPDPNAAAKIIDDLKKMFGLAIDTKELRSEAGKIEEKMSQLVNQVKKMDSGYKKGEVEVPMYG